MIEPITEAVPLSVEEMTEMLALCPVEEEEYNRAIATAAAVERLTNWILAHEQAAGVKVIPALRTVGQAFEPVAMARTADGSPVVALAPEGLELRPFGTEDLDERGMPRWRK